MRKVLFVAVMLSGCGLEPRREAPRSFVERDSQSHVAILLDMSGSFAQEMADGGKAFAFTMSVIDRYFRERVGSDDQLTISQISADGRALIWQGTPQSLRREFTAASFRDLLKSKSNANGSLVHAAMAQTLNHLMDEPAVASGKSKACLLILSDMIETGGGDEQQAIEAIHRFGSVGGSIGMYFVDQRLVSSWRQVLQSAGLKDCCVESEIVRRPILPNFE